MAFALALATALAGCASRPSAGSKAPNHACAQQENPKAQSYLDDWNHANFEIDLSLTKHVLRPIGKGYNSVMPGFLKERISRFFSNLNEFPVVANDILQARGTPTLHTSGRVLINSTIGLFGFFDVATKLGLPPQAVHEDFGLTLAHWGVGEGPYLVLPIMGPTTARNFPSLLMDDLLFDPTTYVSGHVRALNTMRGFRALNAVSKNTQQFDMIINSLNPYVFMRSAYLQHRRFLVEKNGGKPATLPIECYLRQ